MDDQKVGRKIGLLAQIKEHLTQYCLRNIKLSPTYTVLGSSNDFLNFYLLWVSEYG